MKIDLPFETWRALHAMAVEQPVPRHVALPVIVAFEEAMRESQRAAEPAPAPAGPGYESEDAAMAALA